MYCWGFWLSEVPLYLAKFLSRLLFRVLPFLFFLKYLVLLVHLICSIQISFLGSEADPQSFYNLSCNTFSLVFLAPLLPVIFCCRLSILPMSNERLVPVGLLHFRLNLFLFACEIIIVLVETYEWKWSHTSPHGYVETAWNSTDIPTQLLHYILGECEGLFLIHTTKLHLLVLHFLCIMELLFWL